MNLYDNCTAVREELSAYLDGELDAVEREGIESHLNECSDCLRELDSLKRVNDVYGALPPVAAPAGFEDDVRAATRSEASPPRGTTPPVWMGPLVALAAAALVVIGGVLVLEQQQGERFQTAKAPAPAATSGIVAPRKADAQPSPEEEDAWGAFVQQEEVVGSDADEKSAMAQESVSPDTSAWDDLLDTPREARREAFRRDVSTPPNAEEKGTRENIGYLDDDNELRKSRVAEKVESGFETALVDDGEVAVDTLGISTERAEVIGEPPPMESGAETPGILKSERERAPLDSSPVGRHVARSFTIGPDGAWIESAYNGEPLKELSRDGDTLREVMKRFPRENWNRVMDRPARQIFQLGESWYALEAAPE